MKKLSKTALAGAALLTLGVITADTVYASGDRRCGGERVDHGGPGVFGSHGEHRGFNMIETFDINGDGALTQVEIDESRAARFVEFDNSGDSRLSLVEFEGLWASYTREHMVDRFQDLDADGDGQVTAAEFSQPTNEIVARVDRNDDGKLDHRDKGYGHHEDDYGKDDDHDD